MLSFQRNLILFCYLSPLIEWLFYFLFISNYTIFLSLFSIRKPWISIRIVCCIFLKSYLFGCLDWFLSRLSNSIFSNRNNYITLMVLILNDLIAFSWIAWFSMGKYYIAKLFSVIMIFIFLFNYRILIPFNLSVLIWSIWKTSNNWSFIFKWFLGASIANFIKRSNSVSSLIIMKCCLSAFTIYKICNSLS